jgi:hypothetical protein
MTLSLFGPGHPWERLRNFQPIVSGRHPLHLYHGYLGARAFRETGSPCCYDPGFQAGYPKTPVFDGGSRLAEIFLFLGGSHYRPAAYKVGLAVCCLCIPLLLAVAARGLGLSATATCLAVAAGILVCWGGQGRRALEVGDLDLLMAGLAGLAQFGLLVRYDREPGPGAWTGVLLSGTLGWLANPVLFAGLFPLVLLYYLSVGTRHGHLGWHGALLAALAGGVLANACWLIDWVKHWWIRAPVPIGEALLPHRTFHTLWAAPLWGDPIDRALAVALLAAAGLGVVLLNQSKQRPAARLLGLGTGGLMTLAVLGIASEPLEKLGTSHLLVPALWFAAVPAAYALVQSWKLLRSLLGTSWAALAVVLGILLAVGIATPYSTADLTTRTYWTKPLAIGLGPERQKLVRTLITSTTAEARILWEDDPGPQRRPKQPPQRWTSLLPHLTGRFFLGGLDPSAGIEHAFASLVDQNLAGRHILRWTDEELEEFCRRYNVGWVVCWSRAARGRLRRWDRAELVKGLGDRRAGWLFRLKRPLSYALKGQARLVQADSQHITLADVVPEGGVVLLSFHHQAGLRASPSRVRVEREPDVNDPIAFIRLRVSGPVARLTLAWEK